MTNNRKDCPMRHENGNCTVIGGFCLAVNDPICEGLHNAYECGHRDFCASRLQEEREKPTPLSPEELRSLMLAEWVWIETLVPFEHNWQISAYYRKQYSVGEDEIFWCGYPGLTFGFDYADYGKTWLAFRSNPKKEIEAVEAVRMGWHDNFAKNRREFCIEFNELLDPEAAMEIFMRNVNRIFERINDNSQSQDVRLLQAGYAELPEPPKEDV